MALWLLVVAGLMIWVFAILIVITFVACASRKNRCLARAVNFPSDAAVAEELFI